MPRAKPVAPPPSPFEPAPLTPASAENFRHLHAEDARRLSELGQLAGAPETAPRLALSVVVPCFNEEDALPLFMARMIAACQKAVGAAYEIVLVNDGSRDGTWAVIEAMAAVQPAVVGVNLARNHGHQLAVSAGLSVAAGDRVLLIDADLQDPPELLEQMMALCDEGSDVVYGRRRRREQESRFKIASANLFYRVLETLSDVEIPRDVGDFRLMNRRVVDRLNAMPEQDRFLRGMVAWIGGRQSELQYDRDPRVAGESGYTLVKMIRLAVSALTSFSTAPLKAATLLAAAGVLLGLCIVVYALVGFMMGRVNTGWTSLALMMVTFGIAQLGCLGIIGSYVGRIYMQVKGRPLFMIDEIRSTRPEARPWVER
jgi:dolichol-phosphate mannosyltransferase